MKGKHIQKNNYKLTQSLVDLWDHGGRSYEFSYSDY